MKSLTSIILKKSRRIDNKINGKTALLNVLAFLIVFSTISGFMIYFSYIVTKELIKINQEFVFINILLLMNFILLFLKSILESLNVLYFSKDLKHFLRMPLKPKDILHANILNMVISEYQMEIIMLLIPMTVFGILTNANFLFYFYMIIILLILPVIPIVIISTIISIIMRFTNLIKDKTKVTYITIIISFFIIGIVSVEFNKSADLSISNFENLIFKANGLAESIENNFVLIKPIANTLLNYNNIDGPKNLILYISESIICYILGIFIMSKVYLKGAIGTTVNSKKKLFMENKELSAYNFKKRGVKTAYLKKEILTIKRSPIFFIQCILMPIINPITILVIIVVFLNFISSLGLDLLSTLKEISLSPFGTLIYLSLGQVLYMMNFNSAIAISKEGKYAKLTKYLPIDLYKQFKYKINLGVLMNLIAAIIISAFNFVFSKSIINSLCIFILLMIFNHLGEIIKCLIDLKNPKINWSSEFRMMKENTNVMYILFYTLIIVLINFIISRFIENNNVYLVLILILVSVFDIVLSKYIKNNTKRLFSKIY